MRFNPTSFIPIILVGGIAVLGGYFWVKSTPSSKSRSGLARDVATTSRELDPNADGNRPLVPPEGKLARPTARLGARETPHNPGPTIPPADADEAAPGERALVQATREGKVRNTQSADPKVRAKAREVSTENSIHRKMASYFDKKGLSPKQQEAAVGLLDEFGSEAMDVMSLGKQRGLTFKEENNLLVDLNAETVRQLSSVAGTGLGQEIMDRWLSLPLQSTIVAEAQTQCVAAGVPMSSEQMDTLALLLYQSKIDTPSAKPVSADLYNFVTAKDGDVVAAANAILDPKQSSFLKHALAHRLLIAGAP